MPRWIASNALSIWSRGNKARIGTRTTGLRSIHFEDKDHLMLLTSKMEWMQKQFEAADSPVGVPTTGETVATVVGALFRAFSASSPG